MLFAGWNWFGYWTNRPGCSYAAAARSCLYLVLALLIGLSVECSGRVVVVVANRVVLEDLDRPELANISRMMREGGVGLICPNCAGPKSEYSVAMTAACGTGCLGGTENRDFYGEGERREGGSVAGDLFSTVTGYHAPKDTIVFTGLGPALRRNADSNHNPVVLGTLGEALNDRGLRTCLVGNADLPDRPDRSAGVLAMDSRGVIDCGDTRAGYLPGPGKEWPRSLLSDVDALAGAVEKYAGRSEFVVVSFGDTTRLDELSLDISEDAAAKNKARAMRGLDRLMGILMRSPRLRGTKIALVSFSPSLQDTWKQPTPIVVWPTQSPELLVSGTTRTPGFVAASDFAPTVLGLLGVSSSEDMVGRRIRGSDTVPRTDRLRFLHEAETRVVANQILYMPMLLVMVFAGALLFTIVSVLTAFSRAMSSRTERVLRFGLLLSASWPLAMLLATFAPAGLAGYVGGTLAAALVMAAVGMVLSRGRAMLPVMVLYGITVVALVIDVLTGCGMCKYSLPGSGQITAMRFYGIGNEYAGILIAMTASLCIMSARKTRKWVVPVLGSMVVVLFAVGAWGANYGAALSAVVTFALMGMAVRRGSFGARHVLAALVAGFALVFALAYADLRISGITASHAGRATGLMQSLGVEYIIALVSRKVLLNLRQFGLAHTAWVVMSFVPFLVLWFWGVQGKVMRRFGNDPAVASGLRAILVGAVVAFLFNDSGIVMSSIILSMTLLVLIYSLLGKQEGIDCRG